MLPMLNTAEEEKDSHRERRKKYVKILVYHDKRAQDLLFLKMGQRVYFEQKVDEIWILAKIKNILGD